MRVIRALNRRTVKPGAGMSHLPALPIICAVCASLVTLGCQNAGSRDRSSIEQSPFEIVSPLSQPECRERPGENEAPEVFERQQFIDRTTGNFVAWPMDVRCVAQSYSLEELADWSRRGDPVADYALLFEQYPELEPVCDNLEAIEGRLQAIHERVPLHDSAVPSRVPEAYVLIGSIRRSCSVGGWEDYMAQSSQQGISLYAISLREDAH